MWHAIVLPVHPKTTRSKYGTPVQEEWCVPFQVTPIQWNACDGAVRFMWACYSQVHCAVTLYTGGLSCEINLFFFFFVFFFFFHFLFFSFLFFKRFRSDLHLLSRSYHSCVDVGRWHPTQNCPRLVGTRTSSEQFSLVVRLHLSNRCLFTCQCDI